MWTRKFWMDTAERAIRTAAQTLLGAIAGLTALDEFNWEAVGVTVAVATVASVLTSLVGSQVGASQSASVLPKAPDGDVRR